MTRGVIVRDSLLIFCLAAVLIWPLFRLKYMDNWGSIESTFISDARMLGEHLPHPGWQPNWYCGTRFDYIYPPALRYGTALIAKAIHGTTARAYHLYTAFFYAFGIVAVFLMTLTGTGSRRAAYLTAAASALLCPSYWLIGAVHIDNGWVLPQRLHVLTRYGEGPHITALSILPAAIGAAFFALRKGRPAAIGAAGALCALVVANNFYGATALAIFYPCLVWAVWTGERTWRVWLRAASIVALACGLSAFWLTPAYVRITLINLHWVAQPGHTWSKIVLLAAAVSFCAVTIRLANRRPEREWPIFVAGLATLLSLSVLGFYYTDFRTWGNPERLVPEFDLAIVLAAVELLRARWDRPRRRIPCAVAVAIAFCGAIPYLSHPWHAFPKSAGPEGEYPYRIAKWVHENLPGERTLPTGAVRFWYDAWWDNAQSDGGSDQGMLNQILPVASWQIRTGQRPEAAILWMQALGTAAAVVPDKTAQEIFFDYTWPAKFQGALPALYDDGHGTVIYRVPRIYKSLGRVVPRHALDALGKVRGGDDIENLRGYVAVVENPAQPETPVAWRGYDEVEIQAIAVQGQSVLLQETYDPAWHAHAADREIPVRRDPVMGFMLIDAPEGRQTIRLRFETPFENRAGQVVSALSTVLTVVLLAAGVRRQDSSSLRQYS